MPETHKAYQSRDDLLSLLITHVTDILESRRKYLPELNNKLISITFAVLQYIIGKI